MIAYLLIAVLFFYCMYLHYWLYKAVKLMVRDAEALNRLLKVVNASGIFRRKSNEEPSHDIEELQK